MIFFSPFKRQVEVGLKYSLRHFFQFDSMGNSTGLGKVELTVAHVAGIIQKRASCQPGSAGMKGAAVGQWWDPSGNCLSFQVYGMKLPLFKSHFT